eukprot:scaffold20812_cov111-Isochrysis_galbana.AAC.2
MFNYYNYPSAVAQALSAPLPPCAASPPFSQRRCHQKYWAGYASTARLSASAYARITMSPPPAAQSPPAAPAPVLGPTSQPTRCGLRPFPEDSTGGGVKRVDGDSWGCSTGRALGGEQRRPDVHQEDLPLGSEEKVLSLQPASSNSSRCSTSLSRGSVALPAKPAPFSPCRAGCGSSASTRAPNQTGDPVSLCRMSAPQAKLDRRPKNRWREARCRADGRWSASMQTTPPARSAAAS